jgi:hypothetical protein
VVTELSSRAGGVRYHGWDVGSLLSFVFLGTVDLIPERLLGGISIPDQYNIVTAPLCPTRVTRMLLVIGSLLFVDSQQIL